MTGDINTLCYFHISNAMKKTIANNTQNSDFFYNLQYHMKKRKRRQKTDCKSCGTIVGYVRAYYILGYEIIMCNEHFLVSAFLILGDHNIYLVLFICFIKKTYFCCFGNFMMMQSTTQVTVLMDSISFISPVNRN